MKKEVYLLVSSTSGQSATELDYITTDYEQLLIHLYFNLKSDTEYRDFSPNKAINEIVLKFPMGTDITSKKLMKGNKEHLVKIKWQEVQDIQKKIRNNKIDSVLND